MDVRLPGNLSDKELIKKYTQVQHLVSPEARAKGKTEIKRVPKEDLDAFKQAWSECRTKPEKDKVWARFFRPLAEVLKARQIIGISAPAQNLHYIGPPHPKAKHSIKEYRPSDFCA